MRDICAFDGMQSLERDRCNIKVLEQALPIAEQHRCQISMNFVQQTGLKALLDERRAADNDMLFSGDLPGLLDGAATPSVTNVNSEPSLSHACGG